MGKIRTKVKAFLDDNVGSSIIKYDNISSRAEYVSFDIFDTLIVRDVNRPTDLFSMLERQTNIPGFARKRTEAEQTARRSAPGGEPTIMEIYREFPEIPYDEAEAYCQKELEAELTVCHVDPVMLEVYRKCVKNKKVVLISDMYLPSEMIRQILEKCGITGYEKLYISCEARASKRSGRLYGYVLSDLKISKEKIVHIGNDIISDLVGAKIGGIDSMKIRTKRPCRRTDEKHTANVSENACGSVLEVNVDDHNCGGVFSLIKNIITNNKSSIKIDIAALEYFEHKENIRSMNDYGSKIYYIGSDAGKLKKQILVYNKFKKLLKSKKYDTVHIHSDTSNRLFVLGLAAKHSGVRNILLHSHSSGVDGNHRVRRLVIHYLLRKTLKYIGTGFISCSSLASEWMFPNIKKDRITIVNNGIDLERFRFDDTIRRQVRKELGITDEILIGNVGRFNYQKNHEYMLKIIKEAADQGINARLLLVGKGENEAAVKNTAKKLGISKYIIFYGLSDRVNELMQAMDIFILPSHFEGLPIVGVEAQAAGLPVIFSDHITREAALNDNVVFCPIDDRSVGSWTEKIASLASDAEHKRIYGYTELKKRRFDISDTVNSFIRLYTDQHS